MPRPAASRCRSSVTHGIGSVTVTSVSVTVTVTVTEAVSVTGWPMHGKQT